MIRGNLDRVTRDEITGWAQDTDFPETPVTLLVTVNDALIGRVLANVYRPDLEKAGLGTGRHAFRVRIAPGFSAHARHVVHVCREDDGAALHRSPTVLEPADAFDQDAERTVAASLEAADTDVDLCRRIDFLVTQTNKLLQLRADRQSNRARRAVHHDFGVRWLTHLPGATTSAIPPAEQGDLTPRALVIDDRTPVVNRDAGSIAILSHMRSLQRLGYEVTFVPATAFPHAEPGGDALEAIGITCCSGPYYASVEEVLRRQRSLFDLVYLHRLSNASKYMALARHYAPKARIVYSVADLHHLRLERQAAAESRPELQHLSRRLQFAEFVAARSADVVITHSAPEAELLRAALPGARVEVVAWSVPLRPRTVAFGDRAGVAFIGGYEHQPNVDAALWLVQEIMPLVWQQQPHIECLLVGSNMPDTLLRIARKGIVPVGYTKDLQEIFNRVRLTVAPLRYGAGLKGKVIESLAAGVPCVCTTIAAEGLGLPESLAARVADSPETLAQTICHLHESEAATQAWAEAGLTLATERFSEATIDRLMKAAIG
jgi:glycosyltransferase involved in cell wall biosynthesis